MSYDFLDRDLQTVIRGVLERAGATVFDRGEYTVSPRIAKRLCGGKVPDHGRERLVAIEGLHFWLGRTMHQGKQIWWLRHGRGWRICGPIAVLGNDTVAAESRTCLGLLLHAQKQPAEGE